MFFCHQERKAEPGSLKALGLVLWKCFSCATGLTDCPFFFSLTSLQSDLWAQHCFTAAWCSCVQFSVLLLEAGGRRAADQSMRRIFIRGCWFVFFFFPKVKQSVWDSYSCGRDVFRGASSRSSVCERRCRRAGCQLLMEKSFRQADCTLFKAQLRHPSRRHSRCAYGTSAGVLHMP